MQKLSDFFGLSNLTDDELLETARIAFGRTLDGKVWVGRNDSPKFYIGCGIWGNGQAWEFPTLTEARSSVLTALRPEFNNKPKPNATLSTGMWLFNGEGVNLYLLVGHTLGRSTSLVLVNVDGSHWTDPIEVKDQWNITYADMKPIFASFGIDGWGIASPEEVATFMRDKWLPRERRRRKDPFYAKRAA